MVRPNSDNDSGCFHAVEDLSSAPSNISNHEECGTMSKGLVIPTIIRNTNCIYYLQLSYLLSNVFT